jgi:hypothetical protein
MKLIVLFITSFKYSQDKRLEDFYIVETALFEDPNLF